MCKECEGWENFQTFVVYSYLDNNEFELTEVRELLYNPDGAPLQDVVREYVETLIEFDIHGLASDGMAFDFVNAAMDIVDWKSIADRLIEDDV